MHNFLTGLDEQPLSVRADLPITLRQALESLSIRSGTMPPEVWKCMENGMLQLALVLGCVWHSCMLLPLWAYLRPFCCCRTLVALESERSILQKAQRGLQSSTARHGLARPWT